VALNINQLRVPRVAKPRLPVRMPPGVKGLGVQAAAGLSAIASGSLAAVPFVDQFDLSDSYGRVAFIISIAAAVIGGVLTIVRFSFGPPLAVGGVALFISAAIPTAVARFDNPAAFSTTETKLVLAAGVAGLVAFVLCAGLFVGRALSALGGIVAVLAFVCVGCTAVLVYIDDSHTWPQVGAIVGALSIAIVIVTGAAKGRWGSIAAAVAAGAQLPVWLNSALNFEDRKAASIAGLVAIIGIVGLSIVAAVLAMTGAADAAFGRGPDQAVVSANITPMVKPHAVPVGGLAPRAGPVLMPVSVMVPESVSEQHASAVATMTAAPAQWSADPYRRHELRYYDGAHWTEHVSDRGVASTDLIG